uniref:Uncharacterized protein n=1 Tax=Scytodes thoracica TaxID=1112478 RepID=A0A0A0V624_SCYTH|nr:hypothetical protein [Scytodes thoracica]
MNILFGFIAGFWRVLRLDGRAKNLIERLTRFGCRWYGLARLLDCTVRFWLFFSNGSNWFGICCRPRLFAAL